MIIHGKSQVNPEALKGKTAEEVRGMFPNMSDGWVDGLIEKAKGLLSKPKPKKKVEKEDKGEEE